MKKMVLVTVGILSLFIIIVKSDAEMKITPSGVTSPDSSGKLHLNGSATYFFVGPSAALISGVNTYSGDSITYGGYFEAKGTSGRGVFGNTTGTRGRGVYGFAFGSIGAGVYGEASGHYGRGVYGETLYDGEATNYGGYFKANGITGRGVHGEAPGSWAAGVSGSGGQWDFYAEGTGTSGEYGPFTGAHEAKFAEDMPEEIAPGFIVSVTGKTETRRDKNGEISLSSTLPTVTISTKAKDKAVFGVIVSDGPLPEDHWHETQEGERFGVVNALGEGRVWVTDFNGQVQAGDYITTSFVQGYGQLQDDDLLHSYTLGKAIETIDWEQVTETVQQNGKTYKRYLIAVVYTSG